MPGHVVNEFAIALVTAEPQFTEGLVSLAEQLPRALAEALEQGAEFGLRERVPGVFAVVKRDLVFFQQSDRPAAGGSGTGAEQLKHGTSSVSPPHCGA